MKNEILTAAAKMNLTVVKDWNFDVLTLDNNSYNKVYSFIHATTNNYEQTDSLMDTVNDDLIKMVISQDRTALNLLKWPSAAGI